LFGLVNIFIFDIFERKKKRGG